MRNLQLNGRWWKLGFLLLAATSVVPEALALPCSPAFNTITRTRTGATCNIAQVKLHDLSLPEATASCVERGYLGELCSTTLNITQACTYNSSTGKYQVTGYVTYRCSTGIEPCPNCLKSSPENPEESR